MAADEKVYQEKADFVADELTAMLRTATRGFVRECEYYASGFNEHNAPSNHPLCPGEEIVVVWTSTSSLGVNVSADSLWAISKDVMKALQKYY